MRIRFMGHSLHPMLIVFPVGLFATSLIWDIAYLASGNPMWGAVSFWTIVAGLVGGGLAAIPGLFDWLAIPDGTRAKRIGLWHMLLNLIVLGLFAISAVVRASNGYGTPTFGEMVVGWIGIGLLTLSAWLGGELVERMGVAVRPDANFDAPSSLKDRGRAPQTP